MKRINNIYDANCTYSKLYEAYLICKRGKVSRLDVILFSLDLEKNLLEILNDLKNETYTFSDYKLFYVYEPKKRKILAATFKDRIVHTWYVNFVLLPYFVPSYINTSYACIKGRGMHKAAKDVRKGLYICSKMYSSPYVLKMDITKFFENTCRDIVYELVKRKIKDKKVLALTRKILDYSSNYDNSLDGKMGYGLPIGNYTSQLFANMYLNELDKYIKESLKVKWYYRYMDDCVLLLENKDIAKDYLLAISDFLESSLKLSLNSKTQIFKLNQGVNFCGYKINTSGLRLRNKGKKKLIKKLKWIRHNFRNGRLSINEAKRYLSGHLGYIVHANISGLTKKYLE